MGEGEAKSSAYVSIRQQQRRHAEIGSHTMWLNGCAQFRFDAEIKDGKQALHTSSLRPHTFLYRAAAAILLDGSIAWRFHTRNDGGAT